ncbi:hypothetical protein LIER_41781 [Lithospermum erythrorhizon]|uniref:Uncharacterized protein n=1 Tax=Lithospermum erythrorhizon TaxID=34254 RepID=A0AAV3RG38_LITER
MASKNTQQSQAPVRGGVIEITLAEGLEIKESEVRAPKSDEAEVFAAGVLTEPDTETVRSSRFPLSKRKMPSGEGQKRKTKKSKTSKATESVEGVEGVPVNEPGVKAS